CAAAEVFDKGSAGGLELAAKVIEAAESTKLEEIKPLYPAGLGIKEKIDLVAREIYGAASVYFESGARRKLEKFSALGFSSLPVCMAKTQSSLSDDPKRLGAPKNWTLTVTDAHLASGAGFIVAVAGNMMLMPGLSKTPQAARMGVDSNGKITGLS
ncbi:MAG: formate--tetrahydrofolate ligase, partial [Deltaproteobacteria bacterium]|nr:formate--tetrahydrofolate ligase [Deltaproteobacteria bacterium]